MVCNLTWSDLESGTPLARDRPPTLIQPQLGYKSSWCLTYDGDSFLCDTERDRIIHNIIEKESYRHGRVYSGILWLCKSGGT